MRDVECVENPMLAWGACYPEGRIEALSHEDDWEDPEDEYDEREDDDD